MDRLIPCGKRGVEDKTDTVSDHDDDDDVANDDVIDDESEDLAATTRDKLTIRQRLFACAGSNNARNGCPKSNNNNNENSDDNADEVTDESSDNSAAAASASSFARKLSTLVLTDHYTVVEKIGTGTFGAVLLCTSHRDQTRLALKKLPRATTKLEDFQREFVYSFQLSTHQSVVKTFDVAFRTRTSYVFAQEYAPKGDLLRSVTPRRGLTESQAKTVARQIGSALEYMHGRALVHRDVKPENILVFDDRLFRVKLADFGVARKVGTLVCKMCQGTAYTPPEICAQPKGRGYRVETNADVWAFGVVIFCILTGSFPWNLADPDTDALFHEFVLWQTRKTSDVPYHWVRFSADLLRLFRRLLECSPSRRPPVGTLFNYADRAWLANSVGRRESTGSRRESSKYEGTRHTGAKQDGCKHGGASRHEAANKQDMQDQGAVFAKASVAIVGKEGKEESGRRTTGAGVAADKAHRRSEYFRGPGAALGDCVLGDAGDRKSRVARVNDWLLDQLSTSLSVS